jgi:hypothetical protein
MSGMAGRRAPAGLLLAAGAALGCLLAGAARAEIGLPAGLSVIYQSEYSYGKLRIGASEAADAEPIFENWLNADYTRGLLTAGLRFVAFSPPDPSIYPQGPDSYGVDFLYAEVAARRFNLRAGDFYALFGRGLALRAYENRPLRVDTNLQGVRGTLNLPGGELTALYGRSLAGNSEDADRERTEPIAGLDLEHRLPLGFEVGGSFVTTDVPSLGTERLEPVRLKAARLSRSLLGVDLHGEFARVDGPETSAGAAPNVHGHGVYGVASTAIGRLGLLAEVKDYDRLEFENEAGLAYILPPAALREPQYNLQTRHPHQLDTRDERGFQLEVTYNTDRLSRRGLTSFLGNWGLTRNHEPERQRGNHFDDAYVEVQQEFGGGALAVGGLSFQRRFDSNEPPDPLLTLWTPIADLRLPLGDRHSLHLQFEHQHASADRLGEFDTEFAVIEWSRSPDLTASLLAEFSNKSETQLALVGENDARFFGGEISYHLREQHEMALFVGARNSGFICVGGVCRYEPAFDGAELRFVTRF